MHTISTTRIKRATCKTTLAVLMGAAAIGLATGTASAELYGDPEAAAEYWFHQSYDNCGLGAVAVVVGQLTGDMPTEEEIINVAMTTPSEVHPGSIYIPPNDVSDPNTGNGTSAGDMVVLLNEYGIDAETTDEQSAEQYEAIPTGLKALAQYVDQGHKVIASVNAETLWAEDGQRTEANHVVVVTGVDTTKGVVHLSDTGTSDGRDKQVSIDTFTRAWSTSDEAMIVTIETA